MCKSRRATEFLPFEERLARPGSSLLPYPMVTSLELLGKNFFSSTREEMLKLPSGEGQIMFSFEFNTRREAV